MNPGRTDAGSRPRKIFSATESSGASESSWWTRAMPRREKAGEDVHQGGLAGAVLADQGVDLAGPQLEINAVHRRSGAKRFEDAAEANGRRG
jgi:hypothetical protein